MTIVVGVGYGFIDDSVGTKLMIHAGNWELLFDGDSTMGITSLCNPCLDLTVTQNIVVLYLVCFVLLSFFKDVISW